MIMNYSFSSTFTLSLRTLSGVIHLFKYCIYFPSSFQKMEGKLMGIVVRPSYKDHGDLVLLNFFSTCLIWTIFLVWKSTYQMWNLYCKLKVEILKRLQKKQKCTNLWGLKVKNTSTGLKELCILFGYILNNPKNQKELKDCISY